MSCFLTCCGSLQKSLEFEDLGPKRIAALEKEAEEWRMKAEDAVASIQDITVTYFAQTSKALAGIICCVYDSYLCMNELMTDFYVSFLSTREIKCSRVRSCTATADKEHMYDKLFQSNVESTQEIYTVIVIQKEIRGTLQIIT